MTKKLSYEATDARMKMDYIIAASNTYAEKLYEGDCSQYEGDKENFERIKNNNNIWRKELLEYMRSLE